MQISWGRVYTNVFDNTYLILRSEVWTRIWKSFISNFFYQKAYTDFEICWQSNFFINQFSLSFITICDQIFKRERKKWQQKPILDDLSPSRSNGCSLSYDKQKDRLI